MRYRTIVADPPWPYEDTPLALQRGEGISRFLPYESMSLDDLAALDVPGLAVADAHLYLWTTQRFIWDARALVEGWGFSVGPILTWCKKPMTRGRGGSFISSTEFCLVARRRLGERLRLAREEAGLSQMQLEVLVRGDKATRLVSRWELGDCYPSLENMDLLRAVLHLPDDFDVIAGPFGRWPTTWFEWLRTAHSAKPEAFMDMVEAVSPAPRLEMFSRRARLGWDTWGEEALGGLDLTESSPGDAPVAHWTDGIPEIPHD